MPPEQRPPTASGERLQKVLARAGFGSRRTCETIIDSGRARVNGLAVVLGARVTAEDEITVDGVPVITDATLIYYLLHKPLGVVTTASDPQGRPTVAELVPASPRVFPIGRLDLDTSGLLVLTNDGELANLLMHPKHGVVKTYVAEVAGIPDAVALERLRQGVELDDGLTAPAACKVIDRNGDHTLLEIAIHEGRNRQIRRMCDEIGHPVVRLTRTKIAELTDPRLRAGATRELTQAEVRGLYGAALRDTSLPRSNR